MKTLITHCWLQRCLFFLLVILAQFCLYGYASANQVSIRPVNHTVSHSVDYANGYITIQWQLYRMELIKFVSIEKTTDRNYHHLVALVPKKANKYTIEYTFEDLLHRQDSLYFRLSLTDTSGVSNYSPYVIIPPPQQELRFSIHPLPNDGRDIHLSFDQALQPPIQVTIQDMVGRIYYSGNYHQTGSRLHIRLGSSFALPLALGSYQVMVSSGGQTFRKTLLIE